MPLPNPYEIIMQIVNFGLLLWLLNKFAYKKIIGYLDQRAETIATDLKEAKSARKKAEQEVEEQKQLLHAARVEAKDIRDKAELSIKTEHEEMLKQSREESKQLMETTKKEIQQEYLKASESLKSDIATLTVQLTEKMLRQNLDATKQEKLVQDYLGKI